MLKRALFAGAALVIGATFMHGAVTPASAGPPNVKPKVKVVPKPRIRVVKPKIRIKIRPQQLTRDKQEKKTTDPTKLQARKVEQPDGGNVAGVNPAVAARLERLGKLVQIEKFKENIEGMLGMLNIAGVDRMLDIPELGKGGTGDDDESASDQSNIPGIRPDLTSIPTGGLASTETTYTDPKTDTTTTKTVDNDGAVVVEKSTSSEGGRTDSSASYNDNGELVWTRSTSTSADGRTDIINRDFEYGTGSILSNYGSNPLQDRVFLFDRETGGIIFMPSRTDRRIDRTQDPDSDSGVVVWIPPSCGSAECNGIRDYLKNPKGTIGQIIGKGTRVHGDREGDPNTGTTQLVIDKHGLVVSYGADSGPAHSGGGRMQRFDPSKFRRE